MLYSGENEMGELATSFDVSPMFRSGPRKYSYEF